MGDTTTPNYEDLEESRQLPVAELDPRLLIVPEKRGEHQVKTSDGVWNFHPSSGKEREDENGFFSESAARRLALQNASDTLKSGVNPRDEDIHLAKEYKERLHGDVGGSWVMKAYEDPELDESKSNVVLGAPQMSLEMQTKQEIFSPRAERLQIENSKVHLGSEIPLDAARRLEKWAA